MVASKAMVVRMEEPIVFHVLYNLLVDCSLNTLADNRKQCHRSETTRLHGITLAFVQRDNLTGLVHFRIHSFTNGQVDNVSDRRDCFSLDQLQNSCYKDIIGGSMHQEKKGRKTKQVKIDIGAAIVYGSQENEKKKPETARIGTIWRKNLPNLNCDKDTKHESKDLELEAGLGCGNTQVAWKGVGRSTSMIGDKLMKRKRSGSFKYKLRDMDEDCAKVMAIRKDGGKGIAVKAAAHLYQTEVQNERGVGMVWEVMEWQEEEKIQGVNNKGPNGIFDKKNWKLLQQKSALHTTRKPNIKKRKTKTKIRTDNAKVGKNGKNVQSIAKFFEKTGETVNQSQSLAKKCDEGGMIGRVGLGDWAKCGNEDEHKYIKLRNTVDRGGGIQLNMWGRDDRAGVGRNEQLEKQDQTPVSS